MTTRITQENNTFQTDSNGRYTFYAAPGRYFVQALQDLTHEFTHFSDVELGYDPVRVSTRYVSQFGGTDWRQRIQNAINDLTPSSPGPVVLPRGILNVPAGTPITIPAPRCIGRTECAPVEIVGSSSGSTLNQRARARPPGLAGTQLEM